MRDEVLPESNLGQRLKASGLRQSGTWGPHLASTWAAPTMADRPEWGAVQSSRNAPAKDEQQIPAKAGRPHATEMRPVRNDSVNRKACPVGKAPTGRYTCKGEGRNPNRKAKAGGVNPPLHDATQRVARARPAAPLREKPKACPVGKVPTGR